MPTFDDARRAVVAADNAAAGAAAELSDRLTKPRGALGRLESAGVQLAGIAGISPPPIPEPAVVAVFAGDHGVLAEGVSPWPAEVTAQMVANFCAGGAAINVLARHAGVDVVVVDVGVAAPLAPADALRSAKVRAGTGNIAVEPAMSLDECRQALDVGAALAAELIGERGARCLITGDMGIGNTTPSAALIAVFTGRLPAEVTGRGTGIDDAMLAHKVTVIERAMARVEGMGDDPLEVLAELGGLEIAALAGFIVGGAAGRVPVLIDGVIAGAALLAAAALCPDVVGYCVAGHRSTEPGAAAVLEHLGLEPLLDLQLRLGEGTGACLALPVLQASAKVLREMATFDSAGVTDKS